MDNLGGIIRMKSKGFPVNGSAQKGAFALQFLVVIYILVEGLWCKSTGGGS